MKFEDKVLAGAIVFVTLVLGAMTFDSLHGIPLQGYQEQNHFSNP